MTNAAREGARMDRILDKEISRRTLLTVAVAATGFALMSAFASCSHPEKQTGKLSKASVNYQDKPNGDQRCVNCKFFMPGNTPTANGTCQLVEGSISPKGWCTKYEKQV